VEPTTGVADAHLGQLAQAVAQDRIVPTMRFVRPTGTLQANNLAGASGSDAIRVDKVVSRVPSVTGFRAFFEYVLQHLLVQAQVSHELFKLLILFL
jgi:hypothetical protein